MSTELVLGALMAAAAVTVATVAGWMAAALTGSAMARVRQGSAALRARLLAQARLFPLLLTIVLVPTQILAFIRFEAGGEETAGPLLVTLAAAGLALVVGAIGAGHRAVRETRDLSRAWHGAAVPFVVTGWTYRAWRMERRDPVVAIIGIARPQLFVAGQVADACTDDELAAIAAHERAHVRAGDNLLRWLFRITPGAGLFARIGEPLERAWVAAAEEAADATARRQASPLELASALIKVARLATGIPSEAVSFSALVGGSELKARIERLLEPPPVERLRQFGWLPAAVALIGAAFLQYSPAASTLHELFELLVSR